MEIVAATGTDLFVGSETEPLQVVRVTVASPAGDTPAGQVVIRGAGATSPEPAALPALAAGEQRTVEIGVRTAPRVPIGGRLRAEAVVHVPGATRAWPFTFEVAEPGWTMFMVSHFHYDPVWWNTQAAYTDEWAPDPSTRAWEQPFQAAGLELVHAHLEEARRDPDYRFVLAELDYLKPFWDRHPEERAFVRRLLAEGRLELVGGTYNEANTNLVSAENTIRNTVYGIGYQRGVIGGSPTTAWQLDVFGHDPQFPALAAAAGLEAASFARGPYHEWGPNWWQGPHADLRWRHGTEGATVMSFPTEFEWVAPSGRGLLTHYMANHYSAGWWMDAATTLEEAEAEAYRLFRELAEVATTRNVLLPVGTDYSPPNRWVTRIARDWNARYVWPRFRCATATDFLNAVRDELARTGRRAPVQTRDMNPVYTGKDVSYIDTKQAHRRAERVLLAAERFAAFAMLHGARFPVEALDKAWRQLVFNAHHDGITGAESDQVYLDLLGGWREAYHLADHALRRSTEELAARVDRGDADDAVVVFNAGSTTRTDEVEVELPPELGAVEVVGRDGQRLPAVVESRGSDELPATMRFLAPDVPGTGYATFAVRPTQQPIGGWRPADGTTISNDHLEVEADPAQGGAIARITDLASGDELLRKGGLAGELVAYGEYPQHPHFAEGPWHLCPNGEVTRSSLQPADVRVERSELGERLVVTGTLLDCRYTQVVTLVRGRRRVDLRTHLDGWSGQDMLFRMRVDADVEGGMPLFEVANAVIGRGFGFPEVDVQEVPFTLDNPCHRWFGVGSVAEVRLDDRCARAIATAEVIARADDDPDGLRELVVALGRAGVTATVSDPDAPRYGRLAVDSNLPDVRVVCGPPEEGFAADVLDAADPAYREELHRQLAAQGWALLWIPAERPLPEVWRPNADLRAPRDLPALLLVGREAIDRVAEDLADAVIELSQPAELDGTTGQLARGGMALLNRGTPGSCVDVDGSLHTSLLRSSSGWPSGVWIDPPRRTTPDGGNFQFQHWSHRFDHAIVPYDGDWRTSGLVAEGEAFDQPLVAQVVAGSGTGSLPERSAFVEVDDPDVLVTAVKAVGNPLADLGDADGVPSDAILVRLHESTGRARQVAVRPHWSLTGAALTDPLEGAREPLDVVDGAAVVALGPFDVATLVLEVEPAREATTQPDDLAPRHEPAQPVFTEHWRHNRGTAPLGNVPLAVHLGPDLHDGDGPFALRTTVASSYRDRHVEGRVVIDAPDGWSVEPPERLYALEPGGHTDVDVSVTPAADARPGRYLVAARIEDPGGQRFEDVARIDVGEVAPDADELEVTVRGDAVRLRPGERQQLEVEVRNCLRTPVHGEAQLLGPEPMWSLNDGWLQGFSVPDGGQVTLRFDLVAPPSAQPGGWWALVKVMAAGTRIYCPAVTVEVVE